MILQLLKNLGFLHQLEETIRKQLSITNKYQISKFALTVMSSIKHIFIMVLGFTNIFLKITKQQYKSWLKRQRAFGFSLLSEGLKVCFSNSLPDNLFSLMKGGNSFETELVFLSTKFVMHLKTAVLNFDIPY